MTQLAILEGENLGKFTIKKIIRQTKNVAKNTGGVALKVAKASMPISEISKFVKKQLLDKINVIIRQNVEKLASKYISPSKLATSGTASLVGSLQPIIQPPIIAILSAIPGAQAAIPFAPSLILAASYKAVDNLKAKALKRLNLNGDFKLEKNKKVILLVGGGIVAYMLLKRKN